MSERWIRALPLLLSSSVLLIAAAWAFFEGKNNTASIAAFAAGLILLGTWAATAVIDWYEGHPQRSEDSGVSPEQCEEPE